MRLLPLNYRLYDKATDGLTKNDHFCALLRTAYERGFGPEFVLFDSWYAGLDNLERLRSYGWRWLTRLKQNRLVNPDGSGTRPLEGCEIAPEGTQVHLQGYSLIRGLRIVSRNGSTEEAEYRATSDVYLSGPERAHYAALSWGIELSHRGLKQHCGIERSQVRVARAQRNHIGCAIRAFVRLEVHRLHPGIRWWEAKQRLLREAIRTYLAHPLYALPATA